jgi:hypothetical protein
MQRLVRLQTDRSSNSVQIPVLQTKIAAESKVIDDKVRQFVNEWNAAKPVSGMFVHSLHDV